MQFRKSHLLILLSCVTLLSSCAFHRKKYENPISKNTLQPDKVLFDRAIGDIERGRYEVARLTLNTLINTYDTSEYMAKAKLAIADSWYREGGSHGLAQAEAEYKDFILFYPTMEEAAESQWKVCQIHYKQMEKADRDNSQAQRAEDECRQLMVQFPNSKYVPRASQMLRNTQEVLGDKEFRTGAFYFHKGSFPAAANRLAFLADQYPLYSGVDEALWELGDSYAKMGDRFEDKAAAAYSRIVKDYPLSDHVDEAKERLETLKRPIPPADPAAVARMKYEQENRQKAGMVSQAMSVFKRGPDTRTAAKTGAPAMTSLRPPVPVSVPAIAAGPPTSSDVSIQQVTDSKELDSRPDARQNPPAPGVATATDPAATAPATPAAAAAASTDVTAATTADQQPLPTNRQPIKQKKLKVKKQKTQAQPADTKTSERHENERHETMSRVLLADDSPHAQRMGERILREEGHQVVTVTNGDTAMLRLKDVDPDMVLADVSMPQISGYELCHYIKTSGNHPHTRVILTVGAVEPLDEAEAKRVQADGVLKKPFEASALVNLIGAGTSRAARPKPPEPRSSVLVLDRDQVRAAVTIAVDASMSTLVEHITEKVLIALSAKTKAHAR